MDYLQIIKDCNDIDKMKIKVNELSKNDFQEEHVYFGKYKY